MAKNIRKTFNTIYPDAATFTKEVMDKAIESLGYTKGADDVPFYLRDDKRPFKGIQIYHIINNSGGADLLARNNEATTKGKMINFYIDQCAKLYGKMLRLGNNFLIKLTEDELFSNIQDSFNVKPDGSFNDGVLNETNSSYTELPNEANSELNSSKSTYKATGKTRLQTIDVSKAFKEIEFDLNSFVKEILNSKELSLIWERFYDYDEYMSLEIGLDLRHFLDQFVPGLFKTDPTTGKLTFVVPSIDPAQIKSEVDKAIAKLSFYTKDEADVKFETKIAANTVAAEVTKNTTAITKINTDNGARDAKIANIKIKAEAGDNRSRTNAGEITKLKAKPSGSGIKQIDATGKTFAEVKALITEDELIEFSWVAGGSAKKIIGFTHTSTDTKIVVSGITTDGEVEHLDLNKTNAGGINYNEEHIESPQIETNKNDITSINTKLAPHNFTVVGGKIPSFIDTTVGSFEAKLSPQSLFNIGGHFVRFFNFTDNGSRLTAEFFGGSARQLKFISVRVNHSGGNITSADISPYYVNIGNMNNTLNAVKKDSEIHNIDIKDLNQHMVDDLGLGHRINEYTALSDIDVDHKDLNDSSMSAQIKFEQIIKQLDKHKEFTKGSLTLTNITTGNENDILDYIKGYTGNVKQTDFVMLVEDAFEEIGITLLGKVGSTYKQWKYSLNGNLTSGESKTIDKATFDKEIADFKAVTLGINAENFKFKDKNGIERTLQYILDNAGGTDPQTAINTADITKNKENVNTIVKHENTLQREVIKNINDLYKLGIRHADPTFYTEKSFGRSIQKTTNFKDNIRTLFDHLGDNKHLLLHIPSNDPNLPGQAFQEQIISYMRQVDSSIDANNLNNAYFMIKAGTKSSNSVRYEIYLTTLPGREPFPNAKWNKNETNTKTYKPATSIKYVFDYSPNLVTNEALTKGDYRNNWETFNKGYESSVVAIKTLTLNTDFTNTSELSAKLSLSQRVLVKRSNDEWVLGSVIVHESGVIRISGIWKENNKYNDGVVAIYQDSGAITFNFEQTDNLKTLPIKVDYFGNQTFDQISNKVADIGRVVVLTLDNYKTVFGVVSERTGSKLVIAGTTTDGDFEHITITKKADGKPAYKEDSYRYKNTKKVLSVNDRQTTGVISYTNAHKAWHNALAHRNVVSRDSTLIDYNTTSATTTFKKTGVYRVHVVSQFYDTDGWASNMKFTGSHEILEGAHNQQAYQGAANTVHLGASYSFLVKIKEDNVTMTLRERIRSARGSGAKHADVNVFTDEDNNKMTANTIDITHKGGI